MIRKKKILQDVEEYDGISTALGLANVEVDDDYCLTDKGYSETVCRPDEFGYCNFQSSVSGLWRFSVAVYPYIPGRGQLYRVYYGYTDVCSRTDGLWRYRFG